MAFQIRIVKEVIRDREDWMRNIEGVDLWEYVLILELSKSKESWLHFVSGLHTLMDIIVSGLWKL
jgi:hypothetical protein